MDYYGTLGPACGETRILKRMFEAGMTGGTDESVPWGFGKERRLDGHALGGGRSLRDKTADSH